VRTASQAAGQLHQRGENVVKRTHRATDDLTQTYRPPAVRQDLDRIPYVYIVPSSQTRPTAVHNAAPAVWIHRE
jgi:hypothetical protein